MRNSNHIESVIAIPETASSSTVPSSPTDENKFLNVKQLADYLQVNEKKIYALASEGQLPCTKVTGKWLFPKELVDTWLLESTHGGVLTDRLIIAGGGDPFINLCISRLANRNGPGVFTAYSHTGTRLGLSLLAKQRIDAAIIHWGDAIESQHRHPALIKRFPQHRNWVVMRLFLREQGLMCRRDLGTNNLSISALLNQSLRWAFRQEGSGTQRFFLETLANQNCNISQLNKVNIAQTESEAAVLLNLNQVDVAPGSKSNAHQHGLNFVASGWEAIDIVLGQNVFFRQLFQNFIDQLGDSNTQQLVQTLGGYNFNDLGSVIWSDD